VLVIGYGSVLTKRPDDGSVETKHVAFNVFLTINWMCWAEKICTLYIFRNTSGWQKLSYITRVEQTVVHNDRKYSVPLMTLQSILTVYKFTGNCKVLFGTCWIYMLHCSISTWHVSNKWSQNTVIFIARLEEVDVWSSLRGSGWTMSSSRQKGRNEECKYVYLYFSYFV